ncbi:2TM domain-containing protein [Aquimarina agarilytica]|uniref:2TM domain-containing protein n=1 Tax=Aquimarina agarilytica TaxID=1087449 RepID=UPI000288FCB7|nr:2TM domain-containing protein [Aquimarina agarilytica]
MDNLQEHKYNKAKERVEKIKKFYTNLMTYILVILGLVALNYYQNKLAYPWVIWPAMGWGLGVILNGITAFNYNPFFNKDWEDRKMQEFLQKKEKTDRWE